MHTKETLKKLRAAARLVNQIDVPSEGTAAECVEVEAAIIRLQNQVVEKSGDVRLALCDLIYEEASEVAA